MAVNAATADRSSSPRADSTPRSEPSAPPAAEAKSSKTEAGKTEAEKASGRGDRDTFEAAPATGDAGRSAPAPADIDPRIAAEAGIDLAVEPRSEGAAGTMAVATVRYQDDQQSGGNHNVYARILGPDGKELPPEDVDRYFDVRYVPGPGMAETAATPKIRDPYGVAQDAWTTAASTGGPTGSYFDIPMYGGNAVEVWVQPRDVPGNPYADYGSQRVGPFSMPGNHHVNYLVSFQAIPGAGSAPASATPVDPTGGQAPASGPVAPAPAAGGTDGMVEGLYQSLLGRPSDPGGKANWVGYGNHLLAQGKSEQEVKDALTTMFMLSDEYQARVASGQVAPPALEPAPAGPVGDNPLLGPGGQPQHFVAGNYTDLGRANTGQIPDPIQDEAGFRAAVSEDLDRLQQMGVDSVRIWAADFPENNLGDDPEVLARRVSLIAGEAAKRGMTVTVDLFDGNAMPKDTGAYREREAQLSGRISTIVGQNAQRSNILWSVGNEIGDPDNPADFAGWYEQKVGQIRDAVREGGGDPSRPMISLQVTPGALGHPGYGWEGARAAMERVVAASDVISPHFYPPGAVGDLPWELRHTDGSVTYPQMDWSSVQAWIDLAHQAGKPVTIGEFGIPRNTERGDPPAADYAAWSSAWLNELRKLGVDQVSFWQLAKNEGGHIDPASADLAWGPNADDTRALLDQLRQEGWISG